MKLIKKTILGGPDLIRQALGKKIERSEMEEMSLPPPGLEEVSHHEFYSFKTMDC